MSQLQILGAVEAMLASVGGSGLMSLLRFRRGRRKAPVWGIDNQRSWARFFNWLTSLSERIAFSPNSGGRSNGVMLLFDQTP